MDNLNQKVIDLVADHFGVATDIVNLDTRFIADLQGDSLDVVELILLVEDKFGVTVTEEMAETLVTVGTLIDFLEKSIA